MKDLRLKDLLAELKNRVGSVSRLAHRLRVSEKRVSQWLRMDDAALAGVRQDNVDAILHLAHALDVDSNHYATPPALWDVTRPFRENISAGMSIPDAPSSHVSVPRIPFLGHPLLTTFGASSSVLTATPSRIGFLAHVGNNLITYKTVRSAQYGVHPWPNAFFCAPDTPTLDPEDRRPPTVFVGSSEERFNPRHGMVNRFGMPSPPPEVWKVEFQKALSFMQDGQLLMLSVVGTASKKNPAHSLVEDFQKVVTLALEAGAPVIELNLSCPNCSGREGLVFQDPELSIAIVKAARQVAPATRLLAKIGYLNPDALSHFFCSTAPFVNGYSAINTQPVRVLRTGLDRHEPAFGGSPGGLSGRPLRRLALQCVSNLVKLREREGVTELAIVAMGGVSEPRDVEDYLNAGADAVQATTIFFADPYFARSVEPVFDNRLLHAETLARDRLIRARMFWAQAVEDLDSSFPDHGHQIAEAAVLSWLDWRKATFVETSAGPRRSPELSQDYFRDVIERRLGPRFYSRNNPQIPSWR